MKNLFNCVLPVLVILICLTGFQSDKSVSGAQGIQWLTIEQAYAKTKTEPRKILIDVYTDWCGWCKVMDRETFRNKAVIDYVNKKYYAVKLDAEQKQPIMLDNTKFEFIAEGGRGIHQLALALTNNQPSFPTTVFLDEKFQMIQPLPGYLKAKEYHQVITFIGDGYYKKEAFETYKSKTYNAIYASR
ncbi:DUF255 domain-containing protein [Dyadobacter flavalbus]|uniref:DUF255 domain-containing protein n=1 Tax=Dyadobacter flavalbus TaxID=2579942 RepID=A0A5M8R0Q8_9BACT|nr:DUF255 domain-containing protein [Dyadobacter flavalbus]